MSPIKRVQPRRSLPNLSTSTTTSSANSRIRPIRGRGQENGSDADTDVEVGNENEAGPSHSNSTGSVVGHGHTTQKDVKGKGKVTERRVLPARIRRSAGGGEGMREVEEMIIDWLERWAEPSTIPPSTLPIHLTSLPLSHVHPPPTPSTTNQQDLNVPRITLTPSRRKSVVDGEGEGRLGQEEKIEVPEWVMVKAGEDDREEAREEMVFVGKGRGVTSPVKRLRRGGIGEELEEDTSDSYYIALHRKYEVFEKRQRIREKEKLQFERYKMKSRLDLLKNIPKLNWVLIVNTILQRYTTGPSDGVDKWAKGKAKIKEKGEEWLKVQLIREGEALMKRFQELLPPEQKKSRSSIPTPQHPSSRLSTPSRTSPSPSPSLTPPPIVLPARVAALRDPPSISVSNKRKRRATLPSTSTTNASVADEETPSKVERRSNRVVRTYSKRSRSDSQTTGVDGTSPGTAVLIDSSEEEEEPDSSLEVIKPSSTKTRRINPAETHTQIIPTPDGTPLAGLSKAKAMPSSRMVNHTHIQQSIKSFFKPPVPTQPIQPLLNARPLAPKATQSTSTSTLPKTPIPPSTNGSLTNRLGPIANHITTTQSATSKMPSSIPIQTQKPPSHSSSNVNGSSRLPCLIEAASRRELSISTNPNGTDGHAVRRISMSGSRHSKGSDGNGMDLNPFGVALPGRVEWKSEFTISDEEDFWPIIANRRKKINGSNVPHVPPRLTQNQNDNVLTPEEVEELEGVEEAVVL
uniref:Something about silencing protein 4 domain-containing protein n=1 Tax=Kwoniella bestiolae CBS 10118 TaxID=1296100 RepID=A0A1B9FV07_9TREE|nr:hypothetical protein I302_08244 [Kwoniella bestiolae CBS 10118]OCF22594.1 hypothetical protein I302_08244 [Kwoniella bestiolae CBS 10118]